LRIDGLHAPAVFDRTLDNPTLLAYVEQSPGADAPAGRRRRARQLGHAQAAGGASRHRTRRRPAALSPAYSPDFNPIELAFAKLRAFLRAARPRTFDQIVDLVARALQLLTPRECRNFVRHCGYRLATDL
jgi:hypothetical protein